MGQDSAEAEDNRSCDFALLAVDDRFMSPNEMKLSHGG
jgi:hypothetical protein